MPRAARIPAVAVSPPTRSHAESKPVPFGFAGMAPGRCSGRRPRRPVRHDVPVCRLTAMGRVSRLRDSRRGARVEGESLDVVAAVEARVGVLIRGWDTIGRSAAVQHIARAVQWRLVRLIRGFATTRMDANRCDEAFLLEAVGMKPEVSVLSGGGIR